MKTVTITKENLNRFYKRNCLSKRTLEHVLNFNSFKSITGVFCTGTITLRKGSNIYRALIEAGYNPEEITRYNFTVMPLSKKYHKTFVIDNRLTKREKI